MRRLGSWAVLVGTLVLCAGCGDPNTSTVTGTVTVDGEPLAEGAIRFDPKDGAVATSGNQIKDGKFTVVGPPGIKKVVITSAKAIGEESLYEDDPKAPKRKISKQWLPARYNEQTELELDVKPGKNPPQEFKLTTK